MTETYGTPKHFDIFDETMPDHPNNTAMGKQERKQQTLQLVVKSNIAFTPYTLWRNLELRGATFSYRSTKRFVSEMQDDGLLEKLEYEDRQNLYIATDEAHQRFRDSEDTRRKKKRLAD
jgi:hypothetical protein